MRFSRTSTTGIGHLTRSWRVWFRCVPRKFWTHPRGRKRWVCCASWTRSPCVVPGRWPLQIGTSFYQVAKSRGEGEPHAFQYFYHQLYQGRSPGGLQAEGDLQEEVPVQYTQAC